MIDKRRGTTLFNSAGAIAARFEFKMTHALAPISAQVFFGETDSNAHLRATRGFDTWGMTF
jgi:hypothetical protein